MKLQWKERIGYGLGDMGCAFAMTTVNTYIMYFYTDIFGISIGAVGTLFLVARIWDAINDPMIGGMIDKSHFKSGKYKPFILSGAVPLAIFSVLCFSAPELSDTGKLIYAYVTYIGLGMLYTLVNTAYSSLSSLMTDDPTEMTKLTVTRMYMSNIGNILLSVGVPVLAVALSTGGDLGKGYRNAAIIFAIGSVILLLTTYFSSKERLKSTATSGEKVTIKEMILTVFKNKPLLLLCLIFVITFTNVTLSTSVGMYYIKYNAGREDLASIFILLTSLPGLISMAMIPHFTKSISKKGLLSVATIISMLGLLMMNFTTPTNIAMLFIGRAVAGFGATMIMGLVWSMIPDTIDYGEYLSGKRLGAITYAAIGFFFKLGNALAGIIPGIILTNAGYVANAQQTQSSLDAIRFTLFVIPFLLFAGMLVLNYLYPLTNKEIYRISSILKERRKEVA